MEEFNNISVLIPFINEGDEVRNTVREVRRTAGDSVDIVAKDDCSIKEMKISILI